MKKLLSILLVVLMLGSITAFAETVTIANPVITVKSDDEQTVVDLSGLSLVMGGDKETSTFAIDVMGDGEPLLRFAMQAVNDNKTVVMSMDGLSNSYKFDVPTNVEQVEEVEVPALNLDTEAFVNALTEGLTYQETENGFTYSVSHTAINNALAILAPAVESVPNVDVAGLTDAVNELKEGNSGVQISGEITLGDEIHATAGLYLVADGQVSDTALAMLDGTVTMEDNRVGAALYVSADVDNSGNLTEQGYVSFVYNEDGPVTFIVNVMDNMFSFVFDQSTGEILFEVEDLNNVVKVTATISDDENGTMDIIPVGDVDSAIDAANMTEEQTNQLNEEATAAVQPVIDYIDGLMEKAA